MIPREIDIIASGHISYIFHLSSGYTYVGLKGVGYHKANVNGECYVQKGDGYFIPTSLSPGNLRVGNRVNIHLEWQGTFNDFLCGKGNYKVLEVQ